MDQASRKGRQEPERQVGEAMRLIAYALLALVTCGIGFVVGLAIIKSELRKSWRAR